MKRLLFLLFTLASCEEPEGVSNQDSSDPKEQPALASSQQPSGDVKQDTSDPDQTNLDPERESETKLAGDSKPASPDQEEPASPASTAQETAPTAAPVPGRPGFCFTPFTYNIVDVRGIPPGTLVKDPMDPNSARVFRAP